VRTGDCPALGPGPAPGDDSVSRTLDRQFFLCYILGNNFLEELANEEVIRFWKRAKKRGGCGGIFRPQYQKQNGGALMKNTETGGALKSPGIKTKRCQTLILVSFAISAIVCPASGCKKAAGGTVKIAYLPITHALPALAAADLAAEGKIDSLVSVELVKFGSWPELLDALNTGRVDGASVLIELASKAKEQGINLKAALLGHRDGNVIIVNPDINSAADLKGRTFAIPHRQSSLNILFLLMLENAGVDVADINVVEMNPAEMPSALANGQVSGYSVAEPFGARSVVLGTGKVLCYSEQLWQDSICCSLVFNNGFISGRKETAQKYIEQYKAAGDYIAKNRDAAKAVAKKYLNTDDAVLDLSLQWIKYDKLEITHEAYKDLTDKEVKFRLTDNPPDYNDFVKQ